MSSSPTILSSLLPLPRSAKALEDDVPFGERLGLALAPQVAPDTPVVRALEAALERHGSRLALRTSETSPLVHCGIDHELPAQGYELRLAPARSELLAGDVDGLHHGLWTLVQILEAAPRRVLPGLRIADAPALAERGVMLDVSRDRVPTMETLFELVEQLARWKLNRLQLYTEHTFAYAGHEDVWRDADPLTPDEVRALDACCHAHRIELVPNQQSFGHMHRWLTRERLRPLAECPEGVAHPFARQREPFSLCPTDPRALALVADLHDQLLACHTSRTLNVGCDETFDLGQGRSREACEARGRGAVYLDWLNALARRLAERGVTMQFWADVLLEHPELAHTLPENAEPVLWGYEHEHPFDEQAAVLAASGRPFQVAPGTSAWQSFAGRFENMVGNVESAVRASVAHGARGLLITDWGDRGHLQPWVASTPGRLTAADLAWNPDAPAERRTPEGMARLLARHAFADEEAQCDASERLATACVALARVAEATGARIPNASPLSVVLTRFDEELPPPELEGLTLAGLGRALDETARAGQLLDPVRGGAKIERTREELRLAARFMTFAARLGSARLEAGGATPVEELPAPVRGTLATELGHLADEHRRLWPVRSRPGGLADSLGWLERPLAALGGG